MRSANSQNTSASIPDGEFSGMPLKSGRVPKSRLKRLRALFLIPASLVFLRVAVAQDYNYIHYDVKEGLAGSTVYDVCQDKDGFIWFATEAGVSRFDGTHFKNFTMEDGLPESEILRIFADSKGRIWIAPFKNTICYYYKGKIHTSENDSLLKKIKLSAVVTNLAENLEGDMALSTAVSHGRNDAYIIRHKDNKLIYLSPLKKKLKVYLPLQPDKEFLFNSNIRTYYRYTNGSLKPSIAKDWPMRSPAKLTSVVMNYDRTKPVFENSLNGSWFIDTTDFSRYEDVFLPGKQVSRALIDDENNFWFCTLGEGVYMLPSRNFKTYRFPGNKTSEIFSIEKNKDTLWAGGGFGKAYTITGSGPGTRSFEKYLSSSINRVSANRLVCIKKLYDGGMVFGFDGFLALTDHGGTVVNCAVFPVKSVDEVDDSSLLVGTGREAPIIDRKKLKVRTVLWPHRSTAVCYYDKACYIGTTDGLYVQSAGHTMRYLGNDFPSLRDHITTLVKSSDGGLWIGTSGEGLVCLKNNQVKTHITTKNGLTSNICRSIFADKNVIWAGTDKGLNKITLDTGSCRITRYTNADGLPSDIINAVYADEGRIYVGSPSGLSFFDEATIKSHSKCHLKILNVTVSDKDLAPKKYYSLPYKDNNLEIAFVGISFKSGGDILYRYRLKGLNNNWDSTRQTILTYPSLPPGDYELELMAINRFGVRSNTAHILVSIAAPFWQTWWFMTAVIGIVILSTWALVNRRFRTIQKREHEQNAVRQKMNELEQMALRSQMNPHFIFNCLNSIQNFIINKDLETTNEYLTGFASLIRQTLDNAEKGTISIQSEIRYLEAYLKLERMRFGNSFGYHIETDPQINGETTHIPTMILQPYVENSIRHGIRRKKNGQGMIKIIFRQKGDELLCIVRDNGIGRQQAETLKSKIHVEYQSKGMFLTAERIKTLNRQSVEKTRIEVIDLTDETGRPAGTEIIIHFPKTYLET